MAKIIELIYAEQYCGDGTAEDPCRNLPQLWTREGELIAQFDPAHPCQSWAHLNLLKP